MRRFIRPAASIRHHVVIADREVKGMLNVLYLINHAGKAGTERYVQTLVERLNRKKINAFFAYNKDGLLRERMQAMGVMTFQLPMRRPFDIKAAWKLSKFCRENKIDIIHTHYLRENYIALLSRIFNPATKVVYTNHFIMKNNAVVRFFNRLMTLLQGRIIAVCDPGRDMLIRNGNRKSIIDVVYNAVEPGYWKTGENSTLRRELGIADDEFVILCASRFAHDKGHAYLVRTMLELRNITEIRFRCVLAGDGPLLDEIRELVRELELEDRILFIGFRQDMKNLYKGSNLYFNSSQHEALSFLIIEALASGLPVVATDMGGNRNIINEKTNCGVLVKYDDPVSTAAEIKRIMEDGQLYEKYRSNAFKAVEEYFNIEKNVDRTWEILERVSGRA